MTREEYIASYQELSKRYKELINNIDLDFLISEKVNLHKVSMEPDFWTDNIKAKKTLKMISVFEKEIDEFNVLKKLYEDITADYELL